MRRWHTIGLAGTALALAATCHPAMAQQGQRRPLTLFEALFGVRPGPVERDRRANPPVIFEEFFPGLRRDGQQRYGEGTAPVARIESPKYYNFVAEKLVRVALKSRVDIAAPVAALQDPAAAGNVQQAVASAEEAVGAVLASAEPGKDAAVSAPDGAAGLEGVDPPLRAALEASKEAAMDLAAPAPHGEFAPLTDGAAQGQGAPQAGPAAQEQPPLAADAGIVALAAIGPLLDKVSVAAEPAIATEIARHYAKAGEASWLNGDLAPNERARAAIAFMQTAGEYGLEAADYAVREPQAGLAGEALALEAARFEIELTARAMRYGLDAATGRVNPNKLSGYHDFPENRMAAAAILEKLAADDAAAALAAFHPANAQFAALKAELAELARQTDDAIAIAPDTLIKPGAAHPELANVIAAIRKKASEKLAADFAVLLAPDATPPAIYSPELVDLVKAFQKEIGLKADGVIGRGTVARLAEVGVAQKRERVLIALEQIRWLPHQLGGTHVFVNQPSFRARYVEGDRTRLEMRVVVGTPANQTSFFHDVIETVEYNPYWGIPQSILVNEYLPKLRANPYYLDERGYIVTDAKGRRIASAAIDWWSIGDKVPFDVKQEPGEANALGELKILFPNKHNIYMHDTPQKALFGNDQRAFSHGCIRLHKPREMAAAVLGTSIAHIEQKLALGHNQEEVKRRIPIYVSYFTAWPTDDGKVEYFADIYGRDANLRKALNATSAARGQG